MKHITTVGLIIMLLLSSCEERFHTWREYNEAWFEEQKGKLGQDPEVIEVRTLKSGVLVEIYHNGYGATPKPTVDPFTGTSSMVRVRYTGTLIDGTVFDSNENAAFYLSSVVDGWKDALSQMRQGSHWKIYVPADRGYEGDGSKNWQDNFDVPPHSVMIFDIDLIDVVNY